MEQGGKKPASVYCSHAVISLKRFLRKPLSIISGIPLLAFLLLMVFVPIFNSHDIVNDASYASYLPPKAFEVNQYGFLDGTKREEGILAYDRRHPLGMTMNASTPKESLLPLEHFMDSIVGDIVVKEGKRDEATPYGYGGEVTITPENENEAFFYSSLFDLDLSENCVVSLDVGEKTTGTSYRPYLNLFFEGDSKAPTLLPLRPYSKGGEAIRIDNVIDMVMAVAPDSSIEEVKASMGVSCLKKEGEESILCLSSYTISSSDDVGFSDANELLLRDQGFFSWSSSHSVIGIKDVNVYECSFRYDFYKALFGDRERTFKKDEISSYIDRGWMSYDYTLGTSSFLNLDEAHCPILVVKSQGSDGGLICTVSMYRYYGYSSSPYFLFGTNANGQDFFKLTFVGLGLSFLLSMGACLLSLLVGFSLLMAAKRFGYPYISLVTHFPTVVVGVSLFTVLLFSPLYSVYPWLYGVMAGLLVDIVLLWRYLPKRVALVKDERWLFSRSESISFYSLAPNPKRYIALVSAALLPIFMGVEIASGFLGIWPISTLMIGNVIHEASLEVILAPNLLVSSGVTVVVLLLCLALFLLFALNSFVSKIKNDKRS